MAATIQILLGKNLTAIQLDALCTLRQEVFVVEQNCAFLDSDGKDMNSWHLWAEDESGILSCARVAPPGLIYAEPSIGRVATAKHARGKGIGRDVFQRAVEWSMERYPGAIKIMAQSYLIPFYASFGFVVTSEEFLEDDLPHRYMVRP